MVLVLQRHQMNSVRLRCELVVCGCAFFMSVSCEPLDLIEERP